MRESLHCRRQNTHNKTWSEQILAHHHEQTQMHSHKSWLWVQFCQTIRPPTSTSKVIKAKTRMDSVSACGVWLTWVCLSSEVIWTGKDDNCAEPWKFTGENRVLESMLHERSRRYDQVTHPGDRKLTDPNWWQKWNLHLPIQRRSKSSFCVLSLPLWYSRKLQVNT